MKKYFVSFALIGLLAYAVIFIAKDHLEAMASAKYKGDDQFVKLENLVKLEKTIEKQDQKIESLVKVVNTFTQTVGDLDTKIGLVNKTVTETTTTNVKAGGNAIINDPKLIYGIFALLCGIIGLYIRKDFKQRKHISDDRTEIIKLLAKKQNYKSRYYDKAKEVDNLTIAVAKEIKEKKQ